jgi:hypothetical protein
MGWIIHATFRPLYPETKSRYPLCRRLGGQPGTIWTGVEKIARTGIRWPDRSACSGSLHRLRYCGPQPLRSIQYINRTPVPKRVGVGTYHYLCFMICNLIYVVMCICWLIYWLYNMLHGMSDIKPSVYYKSYSVRVSKWAPPEACRRSTCSVTAWRWYTGRDVTVRLFCKTSEVRFFR